MTENFGEAPLCEDGTARGRAYSGPLHGMEWALGCAGPPGVLELTRGELCLSYRLVRHPRSQRPVRDDHGSYVYVPERHAETAQRRVPARPKRLSRLPRKPA